MTLEPRDYAQRARNRAQRQGLPARAVRLAYMRAYRRAYDRTSPHVLKEKRRREALRQDRLERALLGLQILTGRLRNLEKRLHAAFGKKLAKDQRCRGSFAFRRRTWWSV